ncbi:PucR family transcriptional regulator [Actinoallomurus rhizosphaericola]|uniref:PucR family transcriptional regulator n=1 Tax=Actinoallomurus rhizosphaericola TaxID=2952536 RepID=UPI0020915C9D|nr:helix-turn-helix domain-containing protein [Actinoallomurus rhizosphaericola]MCO5994252.1 helix-turn-helix domain-containing protein [Actinoallomurus rhizosphaericola]
MEASGGIQARLDALAARIGHGVSVDDPEGRLVAYSAHEAGADAARIAAILTRQVAPAIQDWQNRHGIAEATGPVRVPANPALGMAPRLCVPIRGDRRCLGYLWVLESDGPLDDPAITEALRCAHDLAGALTPGAPADGGVDGLVRRLVGEDSGTDVRDRLAAAVPALVGARIQVCAAVPYRPENESVAALTSADFRRLIAGMSRALRPHPAYVGSFVGATHAVVLLRHPADRPPAADAIHRVAEAVGGGPSPDGTRLPVAGESPRDGTRLAVGGGAPPDGTRFAVGASEPVPFAAGTARAAHAQALAAAELTVLDPALPEPLSWSELGPYRALLRMPPADAEDALAPLDRAGASGDTLTRTLETYLDLGGDAQRTAARLRLHRTSLYYRLGRIADLLGADLGDGLVRLDLHLALKSRRLARRTLT